MLIRVYSDHKSQRVDDPGCYQRIKITRHHCENLAAIGDSEFVVVYIDLPRSRTEKRHLAEIRQELSNGDYEKQIAI